MDKMDLILVFGMLSLIAGTLLTGFSRPLWWALHQRGPDGRRNAPAHYEWYLRIPGIVLLLAAVFVIAMSVTELYLF